jgi:transcription elongation GreA/GreB family factor
MNQVSLGSWVRLTGFVPGEEEVFRIVPEGQADVLENRIPVDSPLARVLVGSEAGDKVRFHPPAGEVELTILEVGRL